MKHLSLAPFGALCVLALCSCGGKPNGASAGAPSPSATQPPAEPSGESPTPPPSETDAPQPQGAAPPAGNAGGQPASDVSPAIVHLREFAEATAARPEVVAERVKVQHLLVSFRGTGTRATRTKEEAEALAADLLARIEAGEDFAALIGKHTDDSAPGIYGMVASGNAPNGWYRRNGMVAAFGDVGWRLAVGELGVAAFDAQKSPFGWHIIRRVE